MVGTAADTAMVVPVLEEAFRDADARVRYEAVLLLGRLAPTSQQARAALIRALSDEDSVVCDGAVCAVRDNHIIHRDVLERLQEIGKRKNFATARLAREIVQAFTLSSVEGDISR
jgi:HEAT repeat protein